HVDPRKNLGDITAYEAVLSGASGSNGYVQRFDYTEEMKQRTGELLDLVGDGQPHRSALAADEPGGAGAHADRPGSGDAAGAAVIGRALDGSGPAGAGDAAVRRGPAARGPARGGDGADHAPRGGDRGVH